MAKPSGHRHGPWQHEHHHHGAHRHLALVFRSTDADVPSDDDHAARDDDDGHDDGHDHARAHGHGHTHGRIDPSILRSRAGVRAVAISLGVLALTTAIQAVVFMASGSVALLADLIHNGGDALTAIPLGVAFVARSARGERWAGYAVVSAVLASASVAAFEAIERLVHPHSVEHLWPLALAGAVGFLGNEAAARVRLQAGRRLDSPALIADGHHARADGFVSLGVVASAGAVALGATVVDPLIGLAITALILRITVQAWHTVRADHAGHDHGLDAHLH